MPVLVVGELSGAVYLKEKEKSLRKYKQTPKNGTLLRVGLDDKKK